MRGAGFVRCSGFGGCGCGCRPCLEMGNGPGGEVVDVCVCAAETGEVDDVVDWGNVGAA